MEKLMIFVAQIMLLQNYCDQVSCADGELLNESDTWGFQNITCFSEWQSWTIDINRYKDMYNHSNMTMGGLERLTKRGLIASVRYPGSQPHCQCTVNLTGRTVSYTVKVPDNVGMQFIGALFKLVSFVNVSSVIEVYTRLNTTHTTIRDVSLYHCWQDVDDLASDEQKKRVCPNYAKVRFKCAQYDSVVYGLGNDTGFLCRATIPDVHFYSNHRMYMVTKGAQFTTRTGPYNVVTLGSSLHQTAPYVVDKQGTISLLLVSQTPKFLIAEPDELRRIRLHWENTGALRYKVTYTCSNGARDVQNTNEQGYRIIVDVTLTPTTRCRVCVQGLYVQNGIYSPPRCNHTTLPEERPSRAPNILCDSENCPVRDNGVTRNVTITCAFPPRDQQNGKIRALKVRLWNDSSRKQFEELVYDNVTSCVLHLVGLNSEHAHFAAIAACNTAGCSGFSGVTQIDRIASHTVPISSGISAKIQVAIALPVAVLVTIATVAIIGWFLWLKRRQRLQRRRLESIEEPRDYDEMSDAVTRTPEEYHVLDPNENETNENETDENKA